MYNGDVTPTRTLICLRRLCTLSGALLLVASCGPGDQTDTQSGSSSGASETGTTEVATETGTTGVATVATETGTTEVEPICGDGMLDPDEICDDGNADDGDGCSSTCVRDLVSPWCKIGADGGAPVELLTTGVAVGPAGEIAVSSTATDVGFGDSVIHKFDLDGQLLWNAGFNGHRLGDLAFGPNGAIATIGCKWVQTGDVAWEQIVLSLISPEGEYLADFETNNMDPLCRGAVTAHPAGFVATWLPGDSMTYTVEVRWVDENFDFVATKTIAGFNDVTAIATDESGRTLVAVKWSGATHLLAFTPEGESLWETTPEGPGGDFTVQALARAGASIVATVSNDTGWWHATINLETGDWSELVPLDAAALTTPHRVEVSPADAESTHVVSGMRGSSPTVVALDGVGNPLAESTLPTADATMGDTIELARSELDGAMVSAGRLGPESELWICKTTP